MKRALLIGFLAIAAISGIALARLGTTSSPSPTAALRPEQAAQQAGMFNVVVDVDHPPTTINVINGGSITLVKQGGGSTFGIQVTQFSTDGRGELLMKMPGGPIGTVATFRPRRSGQGVIQVRLPLSPGGRSFYTITVFVH
jgi:hypothetical protein